jgi:hypothetical protein
MRLRGGEGDFTGAPWETPTTVTVASPRFVNAAPRRAGGQW